MKTCYLAGPMRGLPQFNFAAFDEASAVLRSHGWDPISPADIDREQGFNPEIHDESFFTDFNDLILRDVRAVLTTSATVLLPGWEHSKGARAELAIAIWADREVYLYPSMLRMELASFLPAPKKDECASERLPKKDECILEEAARITRGDRQADYGPPDQDFARTAAMWSALKGVHFDPRDVAMFMIALKLSREIHQNKRDNAVDIAGYARCLNICAEEARKRKEGTAS